MKKKMGSCSLQDTQNLTPELSRYVLDSKFLLPFLLPVNLRIQVNVSAVCLESNISVQNKNQGWFYSPYGMSKRDGASVNVHLLWVDTQHFNIGQHHNAERFVDFPHCNIFFFNACLTQNLETIVKILLCKIRSTLKSVTQAARSLTQVHISEPFCQMEKSQTEGLKHKLEFSRMKKWNEPYARNTFPSQLY